MIAALPFTGAWTEVIGDLSVFAAGVALLKMAFCHHQGCYRLGRFHHGHYRLCAQHHPLVPSSGRITKEHIDQETRHQRTTAGFLKEEK